MRTIALEEHFWTAALAAPPGTGVLARSGGRLLDEALRDLGEARLADMDAAGIDMQVLSHAQPAAQGLDGPDGVAAARDANDFLAAAVSRHPDRLAGFATLPTASPPAAADELQRAVGDLGFVGGLVHSTLGTDGAFLDDPRFGPLLSRFAALDVPLYLHPAPQPAPVRSVLYGGLRAPVAGALATNAWGWHAEAGLHALRLVVSGVFERHPGLRLIIGHGGEMIPFMLARIDDMLLDLGKGRLAAMDAAGIDVQVISHAAPAAQQLGGAGAIAAARSANDQLAAAIASHPDRFAGFATLPTADPAAAADELERAVRDLGLVGALVHSTLGTNGAFLDDSRFEPLLGRLEQLDVPLYLHPAPPPAALRETLFGGLPDALAGRLATSAWGWHAEAGLHALRMVTAGVFDRHPGLRMIIGHGGEMIPFMLDRIDRTLHGLTGLALPPSGYFLRNIWVTTSGMFSLPPVLCAVQVLGVDRVLFSVDYPFGPNQAGRKLLDMLPLSPADRAKIAGGNAQRVLRLGLPRPRRGR